MLETDPEAFQCHACIVAERIDALAPENAAAWTTFRRVVTRFHMDTHTVGVALASLTVGADPDDAADLMARLSLLYDVYYPPKKASDGA